MKLTPSNVHDVFTKCLAKEVNDESLVVDGIVSKYAFDLDKVLEHDSDIASLLDQLPHEFHENSGGGWSFLQACVRDDGNQWGEHPDMEKLFCLGLAADRVESQLPREMWDILPGGMPYYMIRDRGDGVAV